MLGPSNRLTLIEAMRPPAGFHLESAVAVTFTLNLQSLLAVPAAFTLAGQDDLGEDGGGARPVELVHALRANADKLTVFSEAGHISLPPPSRAFGFLERAVVAVKAPRGGIVHPKVWVLRYQEITAAEAENAPERRLRLLVSSRNLTFDTSWDTVLRLDETPRSGGAMLKAVGDLFAGLLDTTITNPSQEHRARVGSLVEALETARFALPDAVDELKVHVFGLSDNRDDPFPEEPERAMIISPFLADGFFNLAESASNGVYRGPVDTLVSRQGALDDTCHQILAGIGDKRIFDDGSAHEASDPDDAGDSPTPRRSRFLSRDDPGRPLRGLHAKVFAFEKGNRARLFVGSANATRAAFRNNLEILIELEGSTGQLGIDRLLEGDDDQPGLSTLLHPYHRSPEKPSDDGDTTDLDQIRRKVAHLKIEGTVEKGGAGGHDWTVTYRSEAPLPEREDIRINCWPVTIPGHKRSVKAGKPLEERFATSLERISGFLAFELLHTGGGQQTGFVVPVTLAGVPEHRDRRLLKALIGDAKRFLRYLLALLYEDSPAAGLEGTVRRLTDSDDRSGHSAIGVAVLEQLLRTMRSDPSKLAGLHPLITDLGEDDALPPGFAELWDGVYAVARGDSPPRRSEAP